MTAPITGAQLYTITVQALLGYKLDPTLFYQLLMETQGEYEDFRDWVVLRTIAQNQTVSPATALTAGSLYLTPFNLPGFNGDNNAEFIGFYEPKRSIVLVAANGITFRWLTEIPMARREEYKDDNSKFYLNRATGQFFLCGTIDQQYTIKLYYKGSSPAVTANTSWVPFPARYHVILANGVAMKYKDEYDYDVVNAVQAQKIERRIANTLSKMENWDAPMQESERDGVDYYDEQNQGSGFISRIVGDNNG